jgi:hypothetical protein
VDLIFEHASGPRPRLRLRLNGYLQRGWEASERALRPDPCTTPPLPVIVPVVLHQGPTPWEIPRLVDLYELSPEEAEVFVPYTPDFAVPMFDLALRQERLPELPAGMARLALATLKGARTGVDLVGLLASMGDDLQAARAAGSSRTLAELVSYTAWVSGEVPDEAYFDRFRRALAPRDQEAVMGEFMLLSERLEAKGRVEGRVEGRVAEARQLLARLLRRRFSAVSPQHQVRLDGASLEDLERWAEQVVVAATPEDVFDPPSA